MRSAALGGTVCRVGETSWWVRVGAWGVEAVWRAGWSGVATGKAAKEKHQGRGGAKLIGVEGAG